MQPCSGGGPSPDGPGTDGPSPPVRPSARRAHELWPQGQAGAGRGRQSRLPARPAAQTPRRSLLVPLVLSVRSHRPLSPSALTFLSLGPGQGEVETGGRAPRRQEAVMTAGTLAHPQARVSGCPARAGPASPTSAGRCVLACCWRWARTSGRCWRWEPPGSVSTPAAAGRAGAVGRPDDRPAGRGAGARDGAAGRPAARAGTGLRAGHAAALAPLGGAERAGADRRAPVAARRRLRRRCRLVGFARRDRQHHAGRRRRHRAVPAWPPARRCAWCAAGCRTRAGTCCT